MVIKIKVEAPQDTKNYEIFANQTTFLYLRQLIVRAKKRHQKGVMDNILAAFGLNIDFAKIGVALIDRALKERHVAYETGQHRYSLTLLGGVGGKADHEANPTYKVK